MPNFFLSWAAGEDNAHVEQFFLDLRERVSVLTGQSPAESGILGGITNGAGSWPRGMAAALASCDVFVALCSHRYFLNDGCGKQWWVFNERLTRQVPQSNVDARPLITLAWALVDPVPPFTNALVAPDAGGIRRGVRQLVRLRSLRDQYHAFLRTLAEQIVAAASASPPARDNPVPGLHDTPSAFTVADLRHDSGAAAAPHVHFAVAAGTRDEMEKVREDTSYYGDTPRDWTPYRPSLSIPLATHARSLAADQLLDSDVGAIEDVLARIEHARRHGEIVVLLVDWWTTQLDAYQRILAEIDRRGLGATAVLVPANRSDREMASNREELRFGLRRTFRNTTARHDALLRTEIETPDGFDADLAGMIEEARNRVFREGPVHRVPPGEQPGDRPLLSGS